MSETVKIIIEIPKEDIELICKTSFVEDERTMYKQSPSDRRGTMMLFRLMDSVKNGIPLDDVKAEIEKCKEVANVPYDRDYFTTVWAYDDAIRVLDNIGKGDSEC